MNALHLYLDSADLGVLEQILPNSLVYGVTTNPTLLKRAGVKWNALPELVKKLLGLRIRALHLQAIGETPDELTHSGRELAGLGDAERIFVKLPATREGFEAAARLTGEGLNVTMTAVYRPEQALFSAQVGASYAAPYLGRLQDSGQDGLELIGQMQTFLNLYAAHPTRLLVASVRTREAVLSLLALGVGSLTLPPALFTELLTNPETTAAAATFMHDAQALKDTL